MPKIQSIDVCLVCVPLDKVTSFSNRTVSTRHYGLVKVRSSAHSNELRLFHINENGIQIGERLAEHEGILGGRPTRRQT